jgi:hypothetical protein
VTTILEHPDGGGGGSGGGSGDGTLTDAELAVEKGEHQVRRYAMNTGGHAPPTPAAHLNGTHSNGGMHVPHVSPVKPEGYDDDMDDDESMDASMASLGSGATGGTSAGF